ALQNAGLGPGGRPSSVLARREGSHAAGVQCNPPGGFNNRDTCRGLIQNAGGRGIGARAGGGLGGPPASPGERGSPPTRPRSAVRSPARPGSSGGRGRLPSLRGGRPRPRGQVAKKRLLSKASFLRSTW